MNITDYHAKYFAHELTRRISSDNIEKLTSTLLDAQVDLNLHQAQDEIDLRKENLINEIKSHR